MKPLPETLYRAAQVRELDRIAIKQFATPGLVLMACAGMGDVLTGILGTLIVQGMENCVEARVGVQFHACAGDLASESDGERGLLVSLMKLAE